MKRIDREIYFILTADLARGWSGLCNVCRHARFSCSCDYPEIECHCGIRDIEEEAEEVWAGGDCWAFRPRWQIEDIVDAVGISLQGKVPDMSNCEELGKRKVKHL